MNKKNVKQNNEKGITLIALVITIIVMLILVAVTISMAVNGGLFEYAGNAGKKTNNAIREEQQLASGKVSIDNTVYNSIDEYLLANGGSNEPPKVEVETIPTTTSYVGCYADLDGNPNTVEGIIYADLAAGVNVNYWGVNFTKAAETTGLKEYTISKIAHAGTFGKDGTEVRDVISVVEDPTGQLQDRFYVMALTDVTTNDYTTFYWYKNASGNMTASDTAEEFETGKANTEKIKGIWELNASTPYGTQDPRDLWAQIESNSNRTWFVPSNGEWAAFADAFDITYGNHSSTYGLSAYYWSSSQKNANEAWGVGSDYFFTSDVIYDRCVRLSTTF